MECRALLLLRPISAYDELELSTPRIALAAPCRAFTVTGFAFLDEKRLYAMKNILLIATGGTIASAEDGNGLSPALTGEQLAQAVPQIAGMCQLDIVQPMNIDSTNMRPQDWMRIRDVIMDGYDTHDGFVVLHGTDTMSYTAAALSYLIQNSDKPIVLTGSQQPMGHPFTDAKLNLYQSLLYAIDDNSRDV